MEENKIQKEIFVKKIEVKENQLNIKHIIKTDECYCFEKKKNKYSLQERIIKQFKSYNHIVKKYNNIKLKEMLKTLKKSRRRIN